MDIQLCPQPLSQGHFDRNSPLSLYSKMGDKWAQRFISRIQELPDCEDILNDETVLKEWLEKKHSFCPTGVDNRYRLQLWLEYENSIKLNRQMNMMNVYNLVGPESTFHNLVMKDARRVAWMLCKPVAYEMQTREILLSGLSRMQKILEKDPFENPKKPDHKLAKLQLDITKMMDLRQHGAPTQKIQELSIKATLGANGEIQEIADKADMATLQKRIDDLKQRKKAAEGRGSGAGSAAKPPSIVDVEVIKDEGEQESASKAGSGDDNGDSSDP